MASRIEIWSGVRPADRVALELPEAVARAIASQPGDRWIDDFVAAVAELRPAGYEAGLALLAENLASAVVTFQLADTFPGDPPIEVVRWLNERSDAPPLQVNEAAGPARWRSSPPPAVVTRSGGRAARTHDGLR